MIAGDRDLATCAGGAFRVVTDKRGAPRVDKPRKEADYSNIELVTAPFDQSAGLDPLMVAVKSMRLFTTTCYKITKMNTLADVLVACGLQYDLTADGVSAGVHPATDLIRESGRVYRVEDQGADSLFVHYTARDAWNQLVAAIPAELANLNAARIGGQFPGRSSTRSLMEESAR